MIIEPSRAPRTASNRELDAKTLAAAPRRSVDDLLRLVPGLLVARHGAEGKGTQLFLRGFDAAHGSDVEVLLEGIPLNELSNVHGQGYLDLGFLIPETIDRVSVSKGAFEIDQGDFATAGTLRFSLGAAEPGTRFGYEMGSTSRHRLLAMHAAASTSFAAVEALHDDGFGVNRRTDRVSATGRLELWRGERSTLSLFALAHGARFGEPGVVPLSDVERGELGFHDVYATQTHGESARALLAATHRYDSGSTELRTVAWAQVRRLLLQENFTGFLLHPVEGDARAQFQQGGSGGVRSDLELRLGGPVRLFAGAMLTTERFGQHEDQLDGQLVPWRRNRQARVWQHGAGLWVGVRWRPTSWLRLEGGGRADLFRYDVEDVLAPERSGGRTFGLLSPRLTASAHVSPRLTLFAGLGRGFRAPEARAITAAQGETPEMAVANEAELGIRLFPVETLQLEASVFGIALEREFVFDHVSGVNLERNSTRRVGAEVGAAFAPWSWLELRGDLTFVDARFVESGAPVPGAPTFLGQFGATLTHPQGFRGGLRVIGLGPRPLANGATAASYAVADLLAAWRRGPVELSLQIDNVSDARWREGEYHFASWWDTSTPRSQLPGLHYSAGNPRTFRVGLAFFL